MRETEEFKGRGLEKHYEILCFRLGNTEFGLEMLSLMEVVNLVEILRVTSEGGFTEGVINYRGLVTPVIDVRRVLRFPPIEHGPDSHIIITEVDNEKVGLIVDMVLDVQTIPESMIERPGSRIPYRNYLHSVAKLDDRMLLLLDIKRLTQPELLTPETSALSPSLWQAGERDSTSADLLHQRALDLSRPVEGAELLDTAMVDFVHFTLGNGVFVIRTDYTKEIVSPLPMTPIPCTPASILGAINIRGVIMPVLDLATLLGVAKGEEGADTEQRFIIVSEDNDHIALLVDHVYGLCSVDEKEISPPIVSIEEDTARFIEGELDYEGQAVCIVRVPMVFNLLTEQ